MQPQPLSFRIFFKIFPRFVWIIILLAVGLKIFVPALDVLANFIINLSATYLSIRFATLIHESGHLFAAKLAGGTPKRLIIGSGHEVFRTTIGNIKIIVNDLPAGGLAYATFRQGDWPKFKFAFFIAGGVLTNLMVALIILSFFGFEPAYLSGRFGVDVSSALFVANALCVLNILPFKTLRYGVPLSSDGLTLLQIPFRKKELEDNLRLQDKLFDAFEHLEKRQHDEALKIYEDCLREQPDSLLPLMNISLIHLYNGQTDKALEILEQLEANIHRKELKKYRGVIYNNLGWIYLLKENINDAYKYAHRAVQILPKSNFAWGTYGAVLIEKGEIQTGMEWLFKNMNMEYPNSSTLSSSSFLMVAYYARGEFTTSNVHRYFVEQHIHLLQEDERMLFERNLKKIGRTFGRYDDTPLH